MKKTAAAKPKKAEPVEIRKPVIQSRALKAKVGSWPVSPKSSKFFVEVLDVMAGDFAEACKKVACSQDLTIIQPQHVRRAVLEYFKDEAQAMEVIDKLSARGVTMGPEVEKVVD
jgi:hypothetical protein